MFLEVLSDMPGDEQVDWTIPASEWSATLSHLEENDEKRAPYIRIHVERAMREWIDTDDLLGTEDLLQEYEGLCSLSLPRFSQTDYSISMSDDVDKVTVRTWIDADLKNEFRRVVDEDTDYRERHGVNRYGAALATALHFCRNGGRRQRINDRIRRLIEAEETAEAEGYDPEELGIHYNDVDLNRLDGRSRKKKAYQIAQRLDPDPGDTLHRDYELRSVIEDVGVKTVVDEYVDLVVDLLNFKQHPSQPVLYVHESWEPATETATDAEPPAVDRKTFDEMTKAERIEGIRIALARKADEKGGVYAADYNFIRKRTFNRTVSKGYASNIMEDVASEGADGFEFDTRHGSKRIKVNTAQMCDSLLESAGLSESPTAEQDRNQEEPKSDLEAEAEMKRLGEATHEGRRAATDGGTDSWR